jgi:hypothetical protein
MTCVMIADAPSPLLTATIQFGGARLSPRVSCNLAVITVSYSNLYEIFVLEYVLSDCPIACFLLYPRQSLRNQLIVWGPTLSNSVV